MESIKAYCDRALLVDRSELKMDGNPYLVTEEYRRINDVSVTTQNEKTEKDRWGNREVEITEIKILDNKGVETKLFEERGTINIELKYKTNVEGHDELLFGIGFYRQDGLHVTGTNGKNNNLYPVTAKEGTIKYSISNEFFLDNDYSITVAVFDGITNDTLDYHSNRFQFRVRLNNKDQGAVSLPSSWKVLD